MPVGLQLGTSSMSCRGVVNRENAILYTIAPIIWSENFPYKDSNRSGNQVAALFKRILVVRLSLLL